MHFLRAVLNLFIVDPFKDLPESCGPGDKTS